MFRFPDEGIETLLSAVPQGVTRLGTLYVALIASQTADTVPDKDAVLQSSWGVTEAHGAAYKRMPIVTWEPATEDADGWYTQARPVLFPRVGSGGWGDITSYAICTGRVALCYSNFDDLTVIPSGVGDRIEISPVWRMAG